MSLIRFSRESDVYVYGVGDDLWNLTLGRERICAKALQTAPQYPPLALFRTDLNELARLHTIAEHWDRTAPREPVPQHPSGEIYFDRLDSGQLLNLLRDLAALGVRVPADVIVTVEGYVADEAKQESDA